MALVTVIINCYNGSRTLPDAFECLRSQTWRDFEVVFFDNASTDSSGGLAAKSGLPLRYYSSSHTIPLGAARNEAISHAQGELVAFLDCDDLWAPEKLEKQVALFQRDPMVGLVSTDTEVRRGEKTLYRLFERSRPARGLVFDDLMLRQWVSMSSAMLSKAALDSIAADGRKWFDERLQVCEEADVFYRIAHDWKLDYVPEALTVWRIHASNSTFASFAQFSRETRKILQKHMELYPDYQTEHREVIEALEKRADFQEAVALWREGQGAKARELLKPHALNSPKCRLFGLVTWLPGSLFPILARAYFGLPGFLKK